MRTVRELADVLYDCFGGDNSVDEYTDNQIGRMIKKKIGKKKFDEFDELSQEEWRDAWRTFDLIKIGKLKR